MKTKNKVKNKPKVKTKNKVVKKKTVKKKAIKKNITKKTIKKKVVKKKKSKKETVKKQTLKVATKKKDNKKIYRIFYEFIFSPSMHFGVDRKKCMCELCPNKVISKESNIYVAEGEEFYNEPEDTMVVVKDVDAAYDYLMSKYEGDNFDNYGYFDEETNNPNGNDESEFSDGFGDEELNIFKIEVLDHESEKIIETHNM